MTEPGGEVRYKRPLFQKTTIRPAYPLITPLTLGLLKVLRMDMEPDTIYLVDVGFFNYIFVYDRESVGSRYKLFWKLNMANAPELLAECAPRQFEVIVAMPGVPSFDAQFGGRGAWVTLDYTVRVIVKMSRETVALVRQAVNPLQTAFNAARRAAREILPFAPYEESLLAAAEDALREQVSADPRLQATGFVVGDVEIETVKGSEKLAETLQQSFNRILQAKDRREAALLFAEMDERHFRIMAEADDPRGKLELEKAKMEFQLRAAEQVMQSMLVTGHAQPLQAFRAVGEIARSAGPASLAGTVSELLYDKIDWDNVPLPPIPQGVPHAERLEWEHTQLCERARPQLQEADLATGTFKFRVKGDHEIVIRLPEEGQRPQLFIDGQDRRSEIPALSDTLYDYRQTSVWDIFRRARGLLGV